MYSQDYFTFMLALIVCMILSGIASNRVKTSFNKHNGTKCRSGYNGRETVERLMRANRVYDVSIGTVEGFLTDHYHPGRSVVNLSESTYDNHSVAAVAVAAHEMGHVMQKKEGYVLYKIRAALVPVVNFGARLSMPLVLIGLLLDRLVTTVDPNTGFYMAMLGVILYGGSLLFALVTLPVELNASKRAEEMLVSEGILAWDELPAAKEVLSAAALTYLASLLTSIVLFLRLLVRILTMFGRRDNRR